MGNVAVRRGDSSRPPRAKTSLHSTGRREVTRVLLRCSISYSVVRCAIARESVVSKIDFARLQADTSAQAIRVVHRFRFTRPTEETMTSAVRQLAVSAMSLALMLPGVAAANADLEKLLADPNNWAMQAGDM